MEAETHRSAHDWLRLMVDRELAPGLRELGFVAIGGRFSIEVDRYRAEVTVIESQSMHEHAARFTLRLSVLCRDEWSAQLRVRPYYPIRPPHDGVRTTWEAPIGHLVVVGGYPIGDLWWELEAGQPFRSLAQEVLGTMRNFGIPAIRQRIHATG
jgi:hypothetical protein